MKKRVVVALGHRALGTTLPEQKEAVKKTAKVIGDLIEKGYQVAVTHSNAPQVGMIHTAMNEFAKEHEDYTAAPMSVCSAMRPSECNPRRINGSWNLQNSQHDPDTSDR